MPPPKVSYVVAAYNHERYVGELLRSLREQTFRDLEIVVVDDGSSDHTAGIVRQAAQDDPRIQLHQQTNAGVVAARNAGVAKSVGEFISVVDSDDLFPADRTAKMVAALEQSNAGLVYGDAEILHADGARSRSSKVYPVVEGPFSEALFTTHCFVPACAVMFGRSVFSHTGGFWGPGPSTDYLKWIEIGLDALVVSVPG